MKTATIDTAITKAEREIELIKEYKEAMKAVSKDDTVLFQIVSGGRTFYVAIKVKAKD